MDHKTWTRRKKSADKIVVATDHKVDLSSNEEEKSEYKITQLFLGKLHNCSSIDSKNIRFFLAKVRSKSRLQVQSGLSKSLCKIIDLIEGITLSFADDGNSQTLTRKDGSFFPCENTETPSDYMVCVLQWKNSELIAVLQQSVNSSYDLLNGKSEVNMFAQELCSALDWTMNHCFSIQDKKQLNAMASPSKAALFDKVISTSTDINTTAATASTRTALASPRNKILNQRSSLLDQMLKEDSADVKDYKSMNFKEGDNNSSLTVISTKVIEPLEKILVLNGTEHQDDDYANNYLAIVPSKNNGGGNLWRKLPWRTKKSNIKKPSFQSAP